MRTMRWFAVASLAMTVGACATLARQAFETPVVQLRDVRLKAVGYQGGSLELVLDVYNPNAYRIDTSKLTYVLFVDSARVASGAIDQHVTLPDRKNTEVKLPVSFTVAELLQAGQVLTRTGSVNYRVEGLVTVATPFGDFTRPYAGSGRYDSLRP